MRAVRIAVAAAVLVVLLAAGGAAWHYRAFLIAEVVGKPNASGQQAAAGGPPPAMPVPTTNVVKRTLPVWLDYSARIEAIRSVSLRPKVTGYIDAQATPDGTDVNEGDLLYKIDPRDFQAALDQAQANVDRDTAALDYAKANAARSNSLVKSGSIARDTNDQRASTLHQTEAAVSLDRAAARAAQLNLSYTEIRAPFAGRLGRDQAPAGTLVTAGTSTLNTLVQLDPVYVTFNPSERDLAAIAEAKKQGAVKVEVTLPGGKGETRSGDLTFIDNAVDAQTGTIIARATIGNADRAILPGQYVQARLLLDARLNVLMVPQVAVNSGQLGKYVYVIGKDNTAEQRSVTLGATDGDLVAANGVKEDDRVITGNLQKIGPDAPVQPLSAK